MNIKALALATLLAFPAFAAIPREKATDRLQVTTSLIPPVYACSVTDGGPVALANVRLPERPQPGDFILGREILGVSVDWSAIVDGGQWQPSRIACVVVVE